MAIPRPNAVFVCVVLLIAMLAIAECANPPNDDLPEPSKYPKKPKKVKCHRQKMYPYCRGKFECPYSCPKSCYVDCAICIPVCSRDRRGGVCQGPRFVGGDGVTFYFHGKKDRDFCLVSDSGLHINAHFIGKRDPAKTRDFTWVQSIAVLYGNNHTLFVSAEKTAVWDDSVDHLVISYDGETVAQPTNEGATWQSPDGSATSVTRSSDANAVMVEVKEKFAITVIVVPITEEKWRVHSYGITSDDCFAHLELGFKFYELTENVDGVLGQTYREGYVSGVKMPAAMPIMGGDDKFSSTSLFAADCAVALYGSGAAAPAPAVGDVGGHIKCGSGIMSGAGIVCKK